MKVRNRFLALLLSVVMLASSVVPIFAKSAVFPDIAGHWAQKDITALYYDGVVAGYPDGGFHPDAQISRSEFATMLAKWLKLDRVEVEEPSFNDISHHWANQQIEQLVHEGIIRRSEYGKNYGVSLPITRIEMMRMMIRALSMRMTVENQLTATKYVDDSSLSFRDRGIVNACTKYGIISGYPNGTIGAYRKATRAEGAVILKRMFEVYDRAVKVQLYSDDDMKETAMNAGSVYRFPEGPVKEHYRFIGWNTNKDGSGKLYKAYEEIKVDKDMVLYATYVEDPDSAPTVTLEIPNVAEVGQEAVVVNTITKVEEYEYSLKKDGVFVNLNDYATYELTEEGGYITFNAPGHYELHVKVSNWKGEDTDYGVIQVGKSDVTDPDEPTPPPVKPDKPVTKLEITLPSMLHESETGILGINYENTTLDDITFKVEKDGAILTGDSWGKLVPGDGKSGSVVFTEAGEYTITATTRNVDGEDVVATSVITVIPTISIEVTMPEEAMTEDEVEVVLNVTNTDTVEFELYRNGEQVNPADYITGDLPGTISFIEDGTYTIVAKSTDVLGKEFTANSQIIVTTKPEMGFSMPSMFHTGTQARVETSVVGEVGNITWKLLKDGVEVQLGSYAAGTLTNDGGRLSFAVAGEYTLVAEDVDGNEYDSHDFTVLPVPSLNIVSSNYTHVDESTTIDVEYENIGSNDTVVWYLTDANGEVNWNDFVTGELTLDGGNLIFNHAGTYTLNANVTDISGKTYRFNLNTIKVYPVYEMSISAPETINQGKSAEIILSGISDLPVNWSIKKDGVTINLGDIATGDLLDNGGSLVFTEKGEYEITATAIDETGKSFTSSSIITVVGNRYTVDLPEDLPKNDEGKIEIGVNDELPIVIGKTDPADEDPDIDITIKDSEGNEVTPKPSSDEPIVFPGPGDYEVIIKVTDPDGEETEEVIKLTVENKVPSTPVIDVDVNYEDTRYSVSMAFLVKTTITVSSTDPDGDRVTYVYDTNSTDEAGEDYLTAGNHIVKVKAVDNHGAESDWAEYKFNITEPDTSIKLASNRRVHLNKDIDIYISGNGLEDCKSIDYELYKDGVKQTLQDGILGINGGTLNFSETGNYTVRVSVTTKNSKVETAETSFEVYNNAPTNPKITVTTDYDDIQNPFTPEFKVKVNVNVVSTEPDGDMFTYEYDVDSAKTGYYGVGSYTVKVRAVDEYGLDSEWVEKTFSITSSTPSVILSGDRETTRNSNYTLGYIINNASKKSNDIAITITDSDGVVQSGLVTVDTNSDGDISGVKINFNKVGTYTIKMEVINEYGVTASAELSVNVVNLLPKITNVNHVVDSTDYTGAYTKDYACKVTFNVESEDFDSDTIEYEYYNDLGEGYYKVGTHTIKVRAKDANGGVSDWYEYSFSISDTKPTVRVTSPVTAVRGAEISVRASGTNIQDAHYSWVALHNSESDEALTTGLELNGGKVTLRNPGTYTFILTVTDVYGNTAESRSTTSVGNQAPTVPEITITVDSEDTQNEFTKDYQERVYITATSTDPEGDEVTYEYDTTSFNSEYAKVGKYTVRVRAKDSNGAYSAWATKTFEVTDEPVQYKITGSTNIHSGENAVITVTSDDVTKYHVTWKVNKGNIAFTPEEMNLDNNGGTVKLGDTDTYTVFATAVNKYGNSVVTYCDIDVGNAIPTMTSSIAVLDYSDVQNPYTSNYKVKVDFENIANDPDGDTLTYEYDSNYSQPGYYGVGNYTARVRAVDPYGAYSSWMVVSFSVSANKPVVTVTAPTTVHVGSDVEVGITTERADNANFSWSVSKGATALDLDESLLTRDGGTLNFAETGTYVISATFVDVSGQTTTASRTVRVTNNAPMAPVVNVVTHPGEGENPYTPNYKESVEIDISATDPDGDTVTLEYEGTEWKTGMYEKGSYTIKVRAVDQYGETSRWIEKTFEIAEQPLEFDVAVDNENHIGDEVVIVASGEGTDTARFTWSITDPEGNVLDVDETSYIIRSTVNKLGSYTVNCSGISLTGATMEKTATFAVTNNAPTVPTASPSLDYSDLKNGYTKDVAIKVDFEAYAQDPDGDTVTYEYSGDYLEGNYYPVGNYTVKVRAVDEYGATSDWVDVTFEVVENSPTVELRIPASAKPNANIRAVLNGENLDDAQYTWKLSSNGTDYDVSGLDLTGGTFSIPDNGEYILSIEVTNVFGNKATANANISVANSAPEIAEFSYNVNLLDNHNAFTADFDAKVALTIRGVDEDGDLVSFEFAEDSGIDALSSYKPVGEYTVKVRAKDNYGGVSDWYEYPVEVKLPDDAVELGETEKYANHSSTTVTLPITELKKDYIQYIDYNFVPSEGSDVEIVNNPHEEEFFNVDLDNKVITMCVSKAGYFDLSLNYKDLAGNVKSSNIASVYYVNYAPVINSLSVSPDYYNVQNPFTKNAKIGVNIDYYLRTDSEEDETTLEFASDSDVKSLDTYLPVGTYTVKLRVIDQHGKASAWMSQEFTIGGFKPEISLASSTLGTGSGTEGNSVDFQMGINKCGLCRIEYLDYYDANKTVTRENQFNTDYNSSFNFTVNTTSGRHLLVIRAVSVTGEAAYTSRFFTTGGDGQSSGSISISSNGTATYEDVGIYEGNTPLAYVKNYSLQVPDIPGHSGSDYLFVEGWNPTTNAWEQIARVSSNNAGMINSNGDYRANGANGHNDAYKLPEKKYTKVRMGYGMANLHESCLQNASKFEYSVGYEFMEQSLDDLASLFED